MPRTIKLTVRIVMTPEQIKEYCDDYGIARGDVRADLARYVENGIQCSPGLNVEAGRAESVTVA